MRKAYGAGLLRNYKQTAIGKMFLSWIILLVLFGLFLLSLGPRCLSRDLMHICSQIEDPHGEVVGTTPGQISHQFTPIASELRLRVGEAQSFTVSVTPTANYPLDLYILMDLSFSMRNNLVNVKRISNGLAGALIDITADFQIGFGAFNEKPIEPFTFIYKDDSLFDIADYSFRHVTSLTSNVTKFQESLDPIGVAINHDRPEAMLEGLLQVIVCKDVIGWRDEARKLVLVLTDRDYHIAGDGLLVGLARPNDGNCYVPVQDTSGVPVDYPMWGVFDYPSIGQIRNKLQENDIIPIFVSETEYADTYQDLASLIPGSIFLLLDTEDDGFLEIIRNSYNATSQRVELVVADSTSTIQVDIVADCMSAIAGSELNACDNVLIGQTVSFNVSSTLLQCETNLQRNTSLRIPGFGRITVEITGVCSCQCEDDIEYNSTECSGSGSLTCGLCECNEGRFGTKCRCQSEEDITRPCHLSLSRLSCSNRGTCECGQCICNRPAVSSLPANVQIDDATYFGDACECDNFSCQSKMGLLCSGRGECGCGQQCICGFSPISGARYRGGACQCSPVEEACLNPVDNVICSNHGSCPCNHCICESGFGGEYCNIELATEVVSCNESVCVECEKGIEASEVDCAALGCSVVLVEPADENVDYMIDDTLATECSFFDSENCLHYYFTIGSKAPIHAENTSSCSELNKLSIPIWAMALIVLDGLLLIGVIIIVMVKCCIVAYDIYEYRTWRKSKESAKTEQNFGSTDQELALLY